MDVRVAQACSLRIEDAEVPVANHFWDVLAILAFVRLGDGRLDSIRNANY